MCPDQTAATVERRLRASPTRVFDAFADAAIVGRWLTPSPEVSLTVLQFDFRVGGRYRFAYRVPGRGTMHVNGDFRLIEPPERLAFAWNIGRAVRGVGHVTARWRGHASRDSA
jgi:uncharacterized protein YndB with AHSA1/START domain